MDAAALKYAVDAATSMERERCAQIIEAEMARVLGLQKPNTNPLGFEDSVNANLRMTTVLLPDLVAKIRNPDLEL